jgi:hypothetical protein
MNTDQLINAITTDVAPTRPLSRSFGYATMLGIMGSGLIFFVAVGPRQDLAAALETWRFLFKFVITAPLAVAATLVVYRMANPSMWSRLRLSSILIPPCLLASAAMLELIVLPKSLWVARLIGSNSENCMTLIPLLAIFPLACFLIVLKRAAPLHPGMAGALAGLAAGAIAATFYALNCFDDSPLFVVTWYPLAIGTVIAAGYFCGRRFLSW